MKQRLTTGEKLLGALSVAIHRLVHLAIHKGRDTSFDYIPRAQYSVMGKNTEISIQH